MKDFKRPHFEAIFFDMDGLLVDTETLYFKAAREILGTVGVEISEDWYIHEHLGKGQSTLDFAREKGITDDKITLLRKHRNEQYAQLLEDYVVPMSGVPETLELLHGHFQLAIVTGSQRNHLDIIMRKTGLRHFFEFFITADDVKKLKPNPEPYLKAVERSGKEKRHCLVLEDSGNGAQAAKAANLTCYVIPNALTRSNNLSIVDKVLGNIREVPALLGI